MPARDKLATISVITDCGTGIYAVGEIDGCFEDKQLEDYLNMYGADNLLIHLTRLIGQVIDVDKKRRPVEPAYSDKIGQIPKTD